MEEKQSEHRELAQPETVEKANRPPLNRMKFEGPRLTFKRLPRVGDTLTLNGRAIGFCRAGQLGKGKTVDHSCAIQGNEYAQAAALTALINANKEHFKLTAIHDRRSVTVALYTPVGASFPEPEIKVS